MTETVERTATGAILYDKNIINQISDECFTADGWLHAEPVSGELRSAGRGATLYVGNVPRRFVLRHYLRGGLVGRLVHDSYMFSGAERTRSFREWRLLDKLYSNNMRVPQPAAARFCRKGTLYTADILTVRVEGIVSLCQYLSQQQPGKDFWHAIGVAIQEFHAAGVYHADMNAYNLQIDGAGMLWMLDFDKGGVRAPGTWQQQTLRRLQRSLQKIVRLDPRIHYRAKNWEQLLEGYFSASRSA
ncbi:MAG: 3-deoxy-D-manno-octulosonic acid kinase [Gammaproteobacteria bacterium]|nr:3-deoxy-D-manno-octulosonic acid kinase [Gammaproteobacteria bacterium]